ncbi:hypothetical protein [Paraflavitalea speifideaquila]|uniref:hypothetical protein n=1 Tax=Paraflavitalea speifideaquila TaxID=3076558 RepID=UPI0028E898C6|nr:hypothetical protein [Paraflavitalea speifideiaquila]
MKAYLDKLQFNDIDTPDTKTNYLKGVAFYFARSYHRTAYLHTDSIKGPAVLEPNNLTIILYPVKYTEKEVALATHRRIYPNPNGKYEPKTKYKKLDQVYDNFDKNLKKAINYETSGNLPFDLGHTKP